MRIFGDAGVGVRIFGDAGMGARLPALKPCSHYYFVCRVMIDIQLR